MKIKLKKVRLSFEHIFEKTTPPGFEDSAPKYRATFLFAKDSENSKIVKNGIMHELKEKHKDKAAKVYKKLQYANSFCLIDGDEKEYDGYVGNYALRGSNKNRIVAKDKSGNTVDSSDEVFYNGCYVNVICDIYTMPNVEGVFCTIKGVMFHSDGEPFGAGPLADSEFDDFESEDDDDDSSDDLDELDL